MTSRIKDYQSIGEKLALNGAVKLQPLNDSQMKEYLYDMPDLWRSLENDKELRDVARTPLLLSLFTFAFQEASPSDLLSLRDFRNSPGDLRDKIFETYVKRRYEHERRKPFFSQLYNYDEFTTILSEIAAWDLMNQAQNQISYELIEDTCQENPDKLVNQCILLHIINKTDAITVRFIHASLRDYFAFPRLIEYLNHSDVTIRGRAAGALGKIGDPRAIENLAKIVTIKNSGIQISAIAALGKMGGQALNSITQFISSPKKNVRAKAIEQLGIIGGDEAFNTLILLLNNQRKSTIESAATALGHLQDFRAVPHLIRALNNNINSSDLVTHIVVSLGRFNTVASKQILLREALKNSDKDIRRYAAIGLSKMADKEAIAFLSKNLQSSNKFRRISAIEALNIIGESAYDALLFAASSEFADVKWRAISFLSTYQNQTTSNVLLKSIRADLEIKKQDV